MTGLNVAVGEDVALSAPSTRATSLAVDVPSTASSSALDFHALASGSRVGTTVHQHQELCTPAVSRCIGCILLSGNSPSPSLPSRQLSLVDIPLQAEVGRRNTPVLLLRGVRLGLGFPVALPVEADVQAHGGEQEDDQPSVHRARCGGQAGKISTSGGTLRAYIHALPSARIKAKRGTEDEATNMEAQLGLQGHAALGWELRRRAVLARYATEGVPYLRFHTRRRRRSIIIRRPRRYE